MIKNSYLRLTLSLCVIYWSKLYLLTSLFSRLNKKLQFLRILVPQKKLSTLNHLHNFERVFSSGGVGVPQPDLRKPRTIYLLFSKQQVYHSLTSVLSLAIMWIAYSQWISFSLFDWIREKSCWWVAFFL